MACSVRRSRSRYFCASLLARKEFIAPSIGCTRSSLRDPIAESANSEGVRVIAGFMSLTFHSHRTTILIVVASEAAPAFINNELLLSCREPYLMLQWPLH